ncbi:hypothetical protein C8F01DRAFT_1091089 [Mycena amicta]|nr:hypothetical protein C8F01DRAFT_1091089 [Mycena amicta]
MAANPNPEPAEDTSIFQQISRFLQDASPSPVTRKSVKSLRRRSHGGSTQSELHGLGGPVSLASQSTAPHPVADSELETVRDWRHRLRKRFLSRVSSRQPEPLLSATEAVEMDELFTVLENYGDRMMLHYLLYSKIGKFLCRILLLDPVKLSGHEEFEFCDHLHALVKVYARILDRADAVAGTNVTTEDTSTEGDMMVESLV